MTTEETLLQIADATASAVAGVLRQLLGDRVERGSASILPGGTDPVTTITFPAFVTSVSNVGRISGGNIVAMTPATVRRWAAAMMGLTELLEETPESAELERSAMAEATNQMMAAASAAMSAILGQEIDISPPETHLFSNLSEAQQVFPKTPHAVGVSFAALGETCRLLQLIPNAFVVRMGIAFTELSTTVVDEAVDVDGQYTTVAPGDLRSVPVRVHAELGRASMPVGSAVELPRGALVELDREADDPIDLYVSGRLFAHGRLLEGHNGHWAIRIERILDNTSHLASTSATRRSATAATP